MKMLRHYLSGIAFLAFPFRSWVMNPTPFYTVPTLPPSPTPPSLTFSTLFVDMISAPGLHTPHSNKLQFSLGPGPLNSSENTTKHGLTLPPLYALNSSHSLQSHFSKHLSSGPVPSLISSLVSPPSDDTLCQVCRSPFDEEGMLLCDICNAGWHMACLHPPLTTIPAVIWKCPLCTPPVPSFQGPLRHLCFPSPILDPDSD